MRPTALCAIALALTLPACADIAAPEAGPSGSDAVAAATHTASATLPGYTYKPPVELPPLERKPTFWTCAGQAEGRFADAVVRILILETQALRTNDPLLLAEVARLKHEAKMALNFALTQCVATYGQPSIFALPDANGNLVFQPFSVGAYHAYLVAKHLEKPE